MTGQIQLINEFLKNVALHFCLQEFVTARAAAAIAAMKVIALLLLRKLSLTEACDNLISDW